MKKSGAGIREPQKFCRTFAPAIETVMRTPFAQQ
jgi:hypothetical protein